MTEITKELVKKNKKNEDEEWSHEKILKILVKRENPQDLESMIGGRIPTQAT